MKTIAKVVVIGIKTPLNSSHKIIIEPNIKKLQETDWIREIATIAYRIKKIPINQETLLSRLKN